MAIKNNGSKKSWLTVGLVAAALTLGACGKKDESPTETESPVDAQTPVEQEATNTAIASGTDDVDVGIASTDDSMAVGTNDDVAVASADDTAVATSDEVEVGTNDNRDMLDGTEESEHISTY